MFIVRDFARLLRSLCGVNFSDGTLSQKLGCSSSMRVRSAIAALSTSSSPAWEVVLVKLVRPWTWEGLSVEEGGASVDTRPPPGDRADTEGGARCLFATEAAFCICCTAALTCTPHSTHSCMCLSLIHI